MSNFTRLRSSNICFSPKYVFLCFQKQVNFGGIADQAGLQPGDAVVAVNNVDVFNLRHKDAQDLIVRSGK